MSAQFADGVHDPKICKEDARIQLPFAPVTSCSSMVSRQDCRRNLRLHTPIQLRLKEGVGPYTQTCISRFPTHIIRIRPVRFRTMQPAGAFDRAHFNEDQGPTATSGAECCRGRPCRRNPTSESQAGCFARTGWMHRCAWWAARATSRPHRKRPFGRHG